MKRHPYLPDARPQGALGLGHHYYWVARPDEVDMATPPPAPVRARIDAAPQNVVLDLRRTAIVVIDLQNDFCTQGGWVDSLGFDYTADRAPIAPLQKLLQLWLRWRLKPDVLLTLCVCICVKWEP